MDSTHLTAEAVSSKILDLAAEFCERGLTISAESVLRDIGFDELDAVELVMAVEDEFEVDLDPQLCGKDVFVVQGWTVQALVDVTVKALGDKRLDSRVRAGLPVEGAKPEIPSVEEVLASFPPHERRVIDEYCDLVGRRNRLIDFLGSMKFAELPIEDRDLLKRQLDVMNDYAKILVKRCDRFEVPAGLVLPGLVPVDKTADSVQNPHHDPDALAKEMVNRFLGWKLPGDFSPDGGISFTPSSAVIPSGPHWPSGTNLFHAGQALEMFKHCLPSELRRFTPQDVPKLTPDGDEPAVWSEESLRAKIQSVKNCPAGWIDGAVRKESFLVLLELALSARLEKSDCDKCPSGSPVSELPVAELAPKLTTADIEAVIAHEQYFTAADGVFGDARKAGLAFAAFRDPEGLDRVTFCVLTLRNGAKVTGVNYGSVSAANYNAEAGRALARAKAVEKVWELEGYALRERLAASPVTLNLSEEQGRELMETLKSLKPCDLVPGSQVSAGGPVPDCDPGAEKAVEALRQAAKAMRAFTDPEGNMPADTGEFNDLKEALAVAEGVLDASGEESKP